MTDSLNNQIKYRGKLPNSSYYETINNSNNLATTTTTPIINNSTLNNQNQDESPSIERQTSATPSLHVRSCVFSPDGSRFAWCCGYGLVKIMQWKNSSTRKRTISVETTTTNLQSNQLSSSPNKQQNFENNSTPSTTTKIFNNYTNDQSLLFTPPLSLNGSPNLEENQKNNIVDEIVEIDCGELVCSLAFGSTTSFVKHRRDVHRQSRVNTRFNFVQQNLILAVGLSGGKIRIYNGLSGSFLIGLFDHTDVLNDLKFTKDGSLQLASVSNDQTIKLWDLQNDGNMYKTLIGHKGKILSCDWSPTASLLCSVGANRMAFIWDTESFVIKHTLRGHLNDIVTCEFSPDGALVATGSFDTKIILWDPYSGSLIRQFCHMLPPPRAIYASGHNEAYIRSLTFSKGGDHLVSVCDDKKLRIWSLCNRSILPLYQTDQSKGICCAYSTDSKTIMIGTKMGYVDIYQAPVIIQRLVDICRKVVNQYVDHEQINKLSLPNELKRFLLYDDIREQQLSTSSPSAPTTSNNNNNNSMSPISTFQSVALCN